MDFTDRMRLVSYECQIIKFFCFVANNQNNLVFKIARARSVSSIRTNIVICSTELRKTQHCVIILNRYTEPSSASSFDPKVCCPSSQINHSDEVAPDRILYPSHPITVQKEKPRTKA